MSEINDLPWEPNRLYSATKDSVVRGIPQLAKDDDYAGAVQQAWRNDVKERDENSVESESAPLVYVDEDGVQLYGHVVRRRGMVRDNKMDTSSATGEMDELMPGIVFFHTGAGPQDVCLRWKADVLVTAADVFPNGCVVLIADILSDGIGWGWSSDRSRYNSVRTNVLGVSDKSEGVRVNLRKRIGAAMEAIKSVPGVDPSRLAALGWCLGGHSVLELARMQYPGLRCMVTYHGVFDGIPAPQNIKSASSDVSITSVGAELASKVSPAASNILICNGNDDPFVPKAALQNAVDTMSSFGYRVRLVNYPGARHGFTNPAQDFNPNAAFAFHEQAASESWRTTKGLLREHLQMEPIDGE